MTRIPDGPQLHMWATQAAFAHPRNMSRALADKFGVSRQAAATVLRRLVTDGWLAKSGSTTRPVYSPGPNRLVYLRGSLPVAEEHRVWIESIEPFLTLPQNVASLAFYCFTEILNNASDHSGGKSVFIWVRQSLTYLAVQIVDDGEGIFLHISNGLNLSHPRLALLELSKGKTTTDPTNHSGQGIYFSSRMCDYFTIEANDLTYTHNAAVPHDVLRENESGESGATAVFMYIAMNTDRTTKGVFDEYSNPDPAGEGGFYKTVVPVRLARLGSENLVSRSQAKRLTAGFDKFRIVILDFAEVEEIGQAFADELFRVFASLHPEIQMLHVNAAPQVERMIAHVLGSLGVKA